jgi:heavy metal efflux system protein
MFRAATRVMRPLLMMSLSAGIGLLPAALSTGIGSEVQRPLAAVVVGGMLLGSLLLLGVVPACYMPFLGRGSTAVPEAHT